MVAAACLKRSPAFQPAPTCDPMPSPSSRRSFGPCTGITRLQRWERAAKLGLNPPPELPAIVQRHGVDSAFNRDLFYQPY